MHTRKAITEALQKLGVQTGDLLMVHASLKAIGPVEGGAETVVAALRSAVGPTGTVMGYASWDRSPYEETLNGARLDDEARRGTVLDHLVQVAPRVGHLLGVVDVAPHVGEVRPVPQPGVFLCSLALWRRG